MFIKEKKVKNVKDLDELFLRSGTETLFTYLQEVFFIFTGNEDSGSEVELCGSFPFSFVL